MPSEINYQALKDHLELRISIISNTQLRESDPDEQLRQLKDISEKITTWQRETKKIPQQLNHFLKQASFNKALDFIKELEPS